MSLLFGLENESNKDLHDSVMGQAVCSLPLQSGRHGP